MKSVKITMEDYLCRFYEQVGKRAGRDAEQVMADALFKLAGELALQATHDKEKDL